MQISLDNSKQSWTISDKFEQFQAIFRQIKTFLDKSGQVWTSLDKSGQYQTILDKPFFVVKELIYLDPFRKSLELVSRKFYRGCTLRDNLNNLRTISDKFEQSMQENLKTI